MRNDRKFPLNSRLRDARIEKGWSQQSLAERVGTTSVNVSRWENGSTFPTPYFRQQLCEAFEKVPAELGLVPAVYDHKIWNVPITRNLYFTGREDLLALLHKRLSTARTAALTQPQALFGLGGIGKTQTAAEYAIRYGNDYTHVFWIWAATRETLVADFVALAKLLGLVEEDELDQQWALGAIKRWLATHVGWLLILDNADDLPLAQKFLPTSHEGYVLFTTRAQAAGAFAASIEVEKLNLQEGTILLLRQSKLLEVDTALDEVSVDDRATAECIVKEMDGLPLALVQAGAYIEETGCSLADYFHLYATHRKDLLARRSRLLLDYPETVATTWSLSFQQVEQESSLAANLLSLCAFLAPDAIPEDLLLRGAAEQDTIFGTETLDIFRFNDAVEVLRRYSLVRRNSRTHMLTIHRLVQTVIKENMDQPTQRIWAERIVRIVNAAFPAGDSGTGTNQQGYLPHVQECAILITQHQLYFPEAARLLFRAGALLYFHGFHSQSQALHEQALTIREQVLDAEHLAIAESLNDLAVLARLQGKYEQAERYHQRALAIREKMLGPEDPATLLSLNNLGVLYRSQGNYEQAEPLLWQAFNTRKQLFGPEHPETLFTFINLANLYLDQCNYERAGALLEQALAINERVLEPEHTLIAHNLNLLARFYNEQRDYERAEALWKRSLTILEKTLGPEHPATAGLLNELAKLSFAQGRHTQAEAFCRRALNSCEKILGAEHPDTIAYRKLLNSILSK